MPNETRPTAGGDPGRGPQGPVVHPGAMRASCGGRAFVLGPAHGRIGSCHAATLLARPGGELLAACFAGTREGAGDTAIYLTRRRSGMWQAPQRLMAEPGLAHWNPVLHDAGDALWLFFKVGPTVHEWTTRCAVSTDGGESWTAPRPLVPGDAAPRGPVRCKPIVLADGAWLAGGSVESERRWDAFADRSDDRGRTWRRHDVLIAHREAGATNGAPWSGLREAALWESDPARAFRWDGIIQPTLWESAPGAVHMLLRSTRGAAYRSDSADGGRNWCPAYATALPNNNSGLDLVRLPGGGLVVACNPVSGNWGRRSPLSLLGSRDDGRSWQRLLDLEDADGEFSYPALIAPALTANSGELHVAYTWNRTNIVHRRIAVDEPRRP